MEKKEKVQVANPKSSLGQALNPQTEQIKFTDLGLSKEALQAVTSMGFEEPTPIQAKKIGRASCRERV